MVDDKTISGETVTLTKNQFQGLMQRLEAVELGKGIRKPKRVTEREATLRFKDSQPVVKYDNYTEKLEDGKRIAYIDIHLYDGSKLTVKYLEFLNADNNERVKIVSQTAQEVIEVQGKTRTRNPDEAKISSSKGFESNEVDLEVTTYKYSVTVEVLNGDLAGKQFTVDSSALNA